MSVGLLLITHDKLGRNLLDTATMILGDTPVEAITIDVPGDSNPDTVYAEASDACTVLDQGDGVLVLTDLYGSTPSNIATRLLAEHNALVISGLNVPMLVRALNYAACSLEELGSKAESGARDGIIMTTEKQAS
ncbi:MAG: PTS fructose transporter subunit IIA [Gammaproteobacteria bacterium]|nr:PTS fructose transporter subunit IIA [Gammaproteobacteria bacterium]MDH3559647.1 PTS fructose transporter subunit IIA [Gammaproteobacteria bacterium]